MKKILFIDDNINLREEISEALGFAGYDVLSVSNGFEGIEIAKTKKPDLILCDILMPELDGFEVYKQLKENESTSLIPFIFLTALSEQDEVRKGMDLGIDDYIIKPILLQDLLKVIDIRLQKSIKINNRIQTQFNELKEEVIQALPHELLTHLNGIPGFADRIKDQTESISKGEQKKMRSPIKSDKKKSH
jgi:DNA-binding response OmpR family regulator